ncbi:NAD-dependent epimerase/dehydratase family protein [Polynucleobacter paneuropaeus]|nr:NAD-dependent epimerase/dehydratase family protein [Polynucleobacter paneuropaeus]
MNILLTGGAGYIGSHTAVALASAGYTPIILDNFCNSDKSVLKRLEKIIQKPVACVEGDVRNTDIKKSFYYFCTTLFLFDLICNIYNHIQGISWGGIPLEIRPGDWLGRSGGIFGHPFYSIDISLVALFTAFLLRNRYLVPLLLTVVLNLVLAGSQRGMLALALVIILYALFYWRAKTIYIYLVSALIVGAVFLGVADIAVHHPELVAHNERIFRWSYGYEALISNWQQVNNYLRLNPEVFIPQSSSLINSPLYLKTPLFFINAESYYLSEAVNYGLLVSLLSILIFFRVYKINHKCNDALLKLSSDSGEISAASSLQASPSPSLGSTWIAFFLGFFIFLDGFYGYLMGVTFLIFFTQWCVLQTNLSLNFKRGVSRQIFVIFGFNRYN